MFDAPIENGFSGGILANENGSVLGMIVAKHLEEREYFAIPSTIILQKLAEFERK